MSNTTANEVIQSFESSFVDKKVLPKSLEMEWLKKAVGRFSVELDPINFDEEILEFDRKLDRYVIDTLAAFMVQFYQERQVSLANKRISIVSKDLSIDGGNGAKNAEKAHLEYIREQASDMIENQKPTAYA